MLHSPPCESCFLRMAAAQAQDFQPALARHPTQCRTSMKCQRVRAPTTACNRWDQILAFWASQAVWSSASYLAPLSLSPATPESLLRAFLSVSPWAIGRSFSRAHPWGLDMLSHRLWATSVLLMRVSGALQQSTIDTPICSVGAVPRLLDIHYKQNPDMHILRFAFLHLPCAMEI